MSDTSPGAIPPLTHWGLSRTADLVYRAVATRGPQSVSALGAMLAAPCRRVTDALADLHAAGIVTLDDTQRWAAAPPGTVVAALRRHRPRRHAASHPAPPRHQPDGLLGDRLEAIGRGIHRLPNRQATRDRLASLVAAERHEHLVINTEQQISVDTARAALPIHRTLLSRGIRTRVIDPPSPCEDTGQHVYAELDQLRVESRESPDVPLKLFIIDRRVALFPVVPGDNEQGFLEISQAPIVAALHAQFEQCWARATDPREHAVPPLVLAPHERALVQLLAQGHTDATAARELHIGTRSVSKMLRGLMDRLNVDNRFQLGLALGALRAVSPPPRPPASKEPS